MYLKYLKKYIFLKYLKKKIYIFLTYCEFTLKSLNKGWHILQIFDKHTLGNKIILKVYIPQVYEKSI